APAEAVHVAIVLDAKRGQIFTARFERAEGGWVEREPAHLDTLAAVVGRAPRPLYLVGEGLPYHPLPEEDGVVRTEPSAWQARAGVVVALGWRMAREGEFVDAVKLLPLYVRVPEAEEKFAG
ncbi:MAG TPA: hypothetical protein VL992_01125, partial [Tepidisphaeraceae bacterium]|nr:hypothetical protein [Tepidisphaeraceae bacterium]